MTSEKDIAWAAGLFEGEGSCVCYKIPYRANSIRTTVVLPSTDEDVVRKFYNIFKVGSVNGPYKPSNGVKPRYVFEVQNQIGCLYIMGQIYPYLCERRKEQADNLINTILERMK